MNIFTAAVTGLTIVIKNIGIGFNAVMIGLKIAIISVIDFIASMITAIINAIVSAIKWVVTQIVNLIYLLFRTYLRIEAGCVLPVQKFAGFMIRLRSGFVILSGLYAVYQYLGITALLVAIAVCVVLVVIGYSQAEKEEEEWNSTFDWVNRVIAKYLKYLIRLVVMIASVCSLHLMFHNKIVTFSAAALLAALLYMLVKFRKKDNKKCEKVQPIGFIEKNYEPNRNISSLEVRKESAKKNEPNRNISSLEVRKEPAKKIFATILKIYLVLFLCVVIGSLICKVFNFHAPQSSHPSLQNGTTAASAAS